MCSAGIHLFFQITDIRNGIRRFQMGFRVAGAAYMEIPLSLNVCHQLAGILKILLHGHIGIFVPPQGQHIFNARFLKLVQDHFDFFLFIMQTGQMDNRLHTICILDFLCNLHGLIIHCAAPCPKGHTDKVRMQAAEFFQCGVNIL